MSSTADSQHPCRRLFVALWPDEALRKEIDRLRHHHHLQGGRPVPVENVHITLSFLGPVTEQAAACIEQRLGRISAAPFVLKLDRIGYWSRPRVVWLGADEVPAALRQLLEQLNQGLRDCGFQPDPRPFVPHMTLMRKVNRAEALRMVEALSWEVKEFVLVQSHTLPQGAQYTVVGRWPLASAVPGGNSN